MLRETSRIIQLSARGPADHVPAVTLENALSVEYEKLRRIREYPGGDGSSTALYEDNGTHEQWVLIYPADGKFLPIPVTLQPLATLDHPAVLAVRTLTSKSKGTPLYCVEYTTGCLAAPHFSGWDNTLMTIAIVGLVFALRFLHYSGITHGNIQPANVFVSEVLEPKLGPPGAPNLADVASAAYVAPEVRAGRAPDAAADVFSLGATLYEIATNGRRAFPARTLEELTALQSGAVRPEFPDYIQPSVAELIERAWAPNPAERPTANDFYEEFLQLGFLPITHDDVDGKALIEYVTTVCAWESNQGDRKSVV